MDVIKPLAITGSNGISSSVPEADYAIYNAGTAYALGARVMITTGEHRCYESLQAANTGHAPQSNPTWWVDIGATNRWAMFDTSVSTQTVATGALTVSLQPGGISSLALINMDGSGVSVTITDGTGAMVYSSNTGLRLYNADSLHEYFFKPIEYKRFLVLNDLPNYYEGVLTISIQPGVDGLAKCGLCVVGTAYHIGALQYDSGGGNTDFSTVNTDVFGTTTFTPRTSAAKLTGTVWVDTFYVDSVVRVMQGLSAIPCVWSGSEIYESSVIYGYRKDFTFSYKSPSHTIFNIEIQGIT